MLRCCIICSAVDSPDLQLQYCDACQSAVYCSKACQTIDWKKQHKKICKLLNVGHGDMQVRTEDMHTRRSIVTKEGFESVERCLLDGMKRFFKLFQESTFDGSRAAAKRMKKYAKRLVKNDQKLLLSHALRFLVRFSNSEMLSWPNSPLLVMLHVVDDARVGNPESRSTLLHSLADLTDPFDYCTHVNQLILAKQLIEKGASVNAVSIPKNETPLHRACFSGNVTNLDFVEYLLEEGADPNAQDHQGKTPLMVTIPDAPGATKFLLNWPSTDANITMRSGASFLSWVRATLNSFSDKLVRPDNPDRVQDQFVLQQWRGIEEMLVLAERGVADTGIGPLE